MSSRNTHFIKDKGKDLTWNRGYLNKNCCISIGTHTKILLEIEEYFFSSVLTVRLLHSYFYLFRNFIFVLPLYFCVKPQATSIVRNIITCFQHTHVVNIRCRRGPWLGVFPFKSIRSHDMCAHTRCSLSNKCPAQHCNTLYTQHSTVHNIWMKGIKLQQV